MKWTPEEFLKHAKQTRKKFKKSNPNGSKPQKLFKPLGKKKDLETYCFSSDNWNDADLLREYVENKMERKGRHYITMTSSGEEGKLGIKIFFSSYEDDKRATIIVTSEETYDSYEIYWYKHRGRTNRIIMNGFPIMLTDYVNLLNILDKANVLNVTKQSAD